MNMQSHSLRLHELFGITFQVKHILILHQNDMCMKCTKCYECSIHVTNKMKILIFLSDIYLKFIIDLMERNVHEYILFTRATILSFDFYDFQWFWILFTDISYGTWTRFQAKRMGRIKRHLKVYHEMRADLLAVRHSKSANETQLAKRGDDVGWPFGWIHKERNPYQVCCMADFVFTRQRTIDDEGRGSTVLTLTEWN